jgi:hypothetical protein
MTWRKIIGLITTLMQFAIAVITLIETLRQAI